jgi:uncharacterized membrane protein YdbT with pleckstrin-like domain
VGIDLTPGERIIYEGHPSWRSIIDFYFKGAVFTAAVGAGLWAIGEIFRDEGADWALITAVLLLGAALTAAGGFIKRWATRYAITTKRLSVRRGIISRDVQEARVERVQDVGYSQSVIQRLLRIGDIDFDTASDASEEFVFAGVSDPDRLLGEIRETLGEGDAGLGGKVET